MRASPRAHVRTSDPRGSRQRSHDSQRAVPLLKVVGVPSAQLDFIGNADTQPDGRDVAEDDEVWRLEALGRVRLRPCPARREIEGEIVRVPRTSATSSFMATCRQDPRNRCGSKAHGCSRHRGLSGSSAQVGASLRWWQGPVLCWVDAYREPVHGSPRSARRRTSLWGTLAPGAVGATGGH